MSAAPRCLTLAVLSLLMAPASTLRAEPGTTDHAVTAPRLPIAESVPSKRRRALAIGAALVPGVLLHGSGAFVLGDRATARRIARVQALGLAALLAGGLPLGLTYGSPKVADLAIPLLVGGSSLFLASWFADLYLASGGPRLHGRPATLVPLELEAGVLHVYDPQFDYRAFASLAASWRHGRLRLSPDGQLALGADHQRGRVAIGWRLWGAGLSPQRAVISDRSTLEVTGSLSGRRFGDDGFTAATAELMVIGRGDLVRLAPTLEGAFVDLGLGYGIELVRYRGVATDVDELPLGRYGFGLYLGEGSGEVEVHYDHRRDHLAGGLSLAGTGQLARPNGFLGYIGTSLRLRLTEAFALHAGVDVGSAWVSRLTLAYDGGLR